MFARSILSGLRIYTSLPFMNYTGRGISGYSQPLLFKASPCLLAEPLKKKKKLDPAILRAREDRKKRRLEKQIRRLEKVARQPKPIDEMEVPFHLIDQKRTYEREQSHLTPQEEERRSLLQKEWTRYKHLENIKDMQIIDKFLYSQQKSLDELRSESEELYFEAIQIDPQLIPFRATGPTRTPPIPNYPSPDGEYIDVSKKWD